MQGAVHHVIDRVEFILCIVYIFIDDMTCYDYYSFHLTELIPIPHKGCLDPCVGSFCSIHPVPRLSSCLVLPAPALPYLQLGHESDTLPFPSAQPLGLV